MMAYSGQRANMKPPSPIVQNHSNSSCMCFILFIYRHMMLCYDIIIIIIGVVNVVSDCGCHHISLDKPKNELKTESKRQTTSPQNMDS